MRVGSHALLRGTFQTPDEQNKGLMNVSTICFNLSRIHDSVANSHALSFDPGLNEFAAKMFKELKHSAKR